MTKAISIIVAVSENGVIGKNGTLPWRLPADLGHFKALTSGHTIIMGRKTYESIGRPLPDRTNIIITRQPDYRAEGCTVVNSLQRALDASDDPSPFVIGGASVYKEALPLTNSIYLTRVHTVIDGDAFFSFDEAEWKKVAQQDYPADNKHAYSYSFITYQR